MPLAKSVMPYVALTRTSAIAPILCALRHRGVSVERLLAAADLPPRVMSGPEALIPATSGLRLLAAAARETDVPNFGFTTGERTSLSAYGVFGRLLRTEPTVGGALAAAVRYGGMLTSVGSTWLRSREDRVEFCLADRTGCDPGDPAWQQMTQFAVGVMLAVVRLGAGPHWRPRDVHFQTDAVAALRDADALSGARIAFRQSANMIAVPKELLATPIPPLPASSVSRDAIDLWVASGPARDFVGSVRQAIETLAYGDEHPTLGRTATFVGMSTRTLQRRLRAHGASHEQLVAACRFETASAVLQQSHTRILDLALDLGYSDHANFTRAFRRWAGCSPREYRARCTQQRCTRGRAA